MFLNFSVCISPKIKILTKKPINFLTSYNLARTFNTIAHIMRSIVCDTSLTKWSWYLFMIKLWLMPSSWIISRKKWLFAILYLFYRGWCFYRFTMRLWRWRSIHFGLYFFSINICHHIIFISFLNLYSSIIVTMHHVNKNWIFICRKIGFSIIYNNEIDI